MQKRHRATKHMFWASKSSKSSKSDFFENVRNAAMYAIVFLSFFKNMPYVTFGGRVRFACFPKNSGFP